jgi:hypothetical protein
MSSRYDILPQAMQILGARSVAVFSLATGSRVWSVEESQPWVDEDAVVAAIEMIATAQRLVDRADPGSPVDELLAVDAAWFHVLHLLVEQDTGPHVAHMLLDRGVANLALARREFRALVEAERAVRRESEPPADHVGVTPIDAATAPRATTSTSLPQRTATSPSRHETSTGDAQPSGKKPLWLDHFAGRTFATDEHTLRRVLERLRQLSF